MPKLTYAPNSLFYSCTALTEISMPNLEEAGSAFFYCGALTSISLPKLKTAGESCFAYSTKLTQIDIPNVEKLEKMAMYACNDATLCSINYLYDIQHLTRIVKSC